MRMLPLLALSAFSVAAITPAVAQSGMMSHDMKSGSTMKMSQHDMRMMKTCKSMSHSRMMKNASCKKMAKMHPGMMKPGMK